MSESDVKSVALFFYFAFLDDKKAIEASTQALAICRDKKGSNPNINSDVAIVAATHAIWNKYKLRIVRGRPNSSVESGWLVPGNVDLGPWREFQKNATQDELLTVIWSKILNISEENISVGLGITQGTIRYRLGRALRKLGSMTQVVKQKYV